MQPTSSAAVRIVLMDERTQRLITELRAEEIERARQMDPAEKAMDGVRLFDYACRITMDGIRAQFPAADEQEVLRMLRERLAMREAREQTP